MDAKTAVKTCFRKYATFSGRAARSEYWWFALFLIVAQIVLSVVDAAMWHNAQMHVGPNYIDYVQQGGPLGALFWLATIVPLLAAGARRLHDTNRSGWWQLLWFVPLFGTIILIVLLAQGPRDGNRFGDPVLA